jgi:tRNA(Arg) A34 adenosine deaminase TadA
MLEGLNGPQNGATMSTMARVHLATPAATQDYFRLLAGRADYAAAHGNYAISAALVLREPGRETVFEGWNTLFAEHEPGGHAEMNAIRLAHAAASMPDEGSVPVVQRALAAGALHARTRADDDTSERVLYTTLEPCPMCTVCLINAGVDHVIVAAADPPSGTLERTRLRQLPPVWLHLAESSGLEVSFCQSQDESDQLTYLPLTLYNELLDRFAQSRAELDQALGNHGVLDFDAAASHAWALLHGD